MQKKCKSLHTDDKKMFGLPKPLFRARQEAGFETTCRKCDYRLRYCDISGKVKYDEDMSR